jgi:hypothetical protein
MYIWSQKLPVILILKSEKQIVHTFVRPLYFSWAHVWIVRVCARVYAPVCTPVWARVEANIKSVLLGLDAALRQGSA